MWVGVEVGVGWGCGGGVRWGWRLGCKVGGGGVEVGFFHHYYLMCQVAR